ncbi:MFS transporter [Variovorax rhizosphaerae]|uniref:MFS transporter n=1 Tax=Variovorax rhizosphaerae TaxID=1836200 RepID=A0ABU8WJ92_9BURK
MSTRNATVAGRTGCPALFYGWIVVASAFATTFVGFGSAYTFSAFLSSLQAEFAASRGSVSLVFSLAGFLYFALGVLSGPLADRWGARPLLVAGMVLTGAGMALAGMARTLGEVYAAYAIGIGVGVGLAYVPALGTIQRWFVRRRGFASGLAVSGIGVGTLVMPPLASFLIDHWGWRTAYLGLGVGAAVVGVGMALLVADDPRDRGLLPDGDLAPVTPPIGAAASPAVGFGLMEAMKTPRFIALYVACMLASFGLFVPFVHLVPYALDHGIAQASAVLLLGAIGVGSTAGRFLLGNVADRMGREPALILMYAGMAASLVVWLVSTGLPGLAVFALVFGVFYGGCVALLPALVADYFGGKNIGAIIGVLYTGVAVGTLVGPTAAGYIFDATHSYSLVIVASIGGNLVAAAIMWAVSRK